MSEFVRVASTSEIPDPGNLLVDVDDNLVVVFHVDGQFYALDDVCTHDGGPLGEGVLEGFAIACPRHGAKFDIRDGRALTMPATQPTRSHEVEIRGDEIFVKLNAGEPGVAAPASEPTAASQIAPAKTIASTPAETAAKAASQPEMPVRSEVLSEDLVREALKTVVDPELFVNIVDLGLVYEVRVTPHAGEEEKSDVAIEMTLTSPACPAGPQIIQNSKAALARIDGVGEVDVKLVMTPPWAPDRMTDEARDQLGIF